MSRFGVIFELLRRFLVAMAFAVWVGGFTFYGAVVIPTLTDVMGDHTQAGFVTRQVTVWLNWIGVVTIALLLWNAVIALRTRDKWLRRTIWTSLVLITAIEITVIIMHPILDRMLDPAERSILQPDRFEFLHRVYLWLSTLQWFACLAQLAGVLIEWRFHDRRAPVSSPLIPQEIRP